MCCSVNYHRNCGWNVVAGYCNRGNAPDFLVFNNLLMPAAIRAAYSQKRTDKRRNAYILKEALQLLFFVQINKLHIKNDKNKNRIHYERENEYER